MHELQIKFINPLALLQICYITKKIITMENAILERVMNQTKNLKTLTEELQVQMALGKAEARDLIEKERKNLSKYINKQKKELTDNLSISNDNKKEFLHTIENLEIKLNSTVPTESLVYDQYKSEVLQNVYQLEEELKKNYSSMGQEMKENLDVFKNKMDAFRVNLALHDKDDPEKVEKIRNEFSQKLEEVSNLLGERETAQTKLDNFVEDISESYKFLKKAITDLAN